MEPTRLPLLLLKTEIVQAAGFRMLGTVREYTMGTSDSRRIKDGCILRYPRLVYIETYMGVSPDVDA